MSFSLDLSRFVEKAGKAAEQGVRKICLDLTTAVIGDTPVDTGRLRANWQATVDSPASGVTDDTDKKGNGEATVKKADAAIALAAGKIFYLTNNLPYAVVAEHGLWKGGAGATQKTTRDGYSVQSAYGMVRVNVERVKRANS